MKKLLFSLAALALLLASSCQMREKEFVDEKATAPEIVATVETDSATRTLIDVDQLGEGTIYWTPADEINIFYGTASTHYVSQNTANATTAVFRTTDVIGSTESASTNIWGLYPYDANATSTGSAISTTLPATQYGVPDTFDDDLYITLAHSNSTALKFYNVCGGIKFSLSRGDITSIKFKGNNNEPIAGDISLTFENGLPKATVVNGLTEITLTPKTGTTFAQNTNYYIVALPGTLTGGFTMTFTTSGSVGTFNYTTGAVTIKRSIFSKKEEIDTYATFTEVQPNIPDDFNPNSYLVYRANKTEYNSGRDYYSIQSHMPGISGAKVELKFQLAEGSQKTIASDNVGSDYSFSLLKLQDGALLWSNWDDNDDDCFDFSLRLSDFGLSETDLIVLCYDSINSTLSLNNQQTSCQHGNMSFRTLFAEYYSEYDEGRRTVYTGVPDGSKLYYVKVWDSDDVLSYIGYATTAINPDTNELERCWRGFNMKTEEATYDFANDANNQGGYLGSVPLSLTPEAIDLGLPSGTKWASFNLGATEPEELGDFYAWGETEPYYCSFEPMIWKDDKEEGYSWSSYKWATSYSTMTKYCYSPAYGYNGFTDGKTTLDPEDDVARFYLGGNWRMPTKYDFIELQSNCTWQWTSQNGINGYMVTGANGNRIFLPAAGTIGQTTYKDVGYDGNYWSSSLNMETDDCSFAHFFQFNSSSTEIKYDGSRYSGLSIRPVSGNSTLRVERVTLNRTELKLFVSETVNLVATVLPQNAANTNIIWSSSDESVATVSASGLVTGIRTGSVVISVTTSDGGMIATCAVTVSSPVAVVPDAIDLGLSVKWASFNLGASKPEEYGDYYAWGELWPKSDYSWETYKWCNGTMSSLTKYCSHYAYGNGYDYLTELEDSDDAAKVCLGGKWRMPTSAEMTELKQNTVAVAATVNGVKGYTFTERATGNSIFIPFAGTMIGTELVSPEGGFYCWSKTRNFSYDYNGLYLSSYNSGIASYVRSAGLTIRPVYVE